MLVCATKWKIWILTSFPVSFDTAIRLCLPSHLVVVVVLVIVMAHFCSLSQQFKRCIYSQSILPWKTFFENVSKDIRLTPIKLLYRDVSCCCIRSDTVVFRCHKQWLWPKKFRRRRRERKEKELNLESTTKLSIFNREIKRNLLNRDSSVCVRAQALLLASSQWINSNIVVVQYSISSATTYLADCWRLY